MPAHIDNIRLNVTASPESGVVMGGSADPYLPPPGGSTGLDLGIILPEIIMPSK